MKIVFIFYKSRFIKKSFFVLSIIIKYTLDMYIAGNVKFRLRDTHSTTCGTYVTLNM